MTTTDEMSQPADSYDKIVNEHRDRLAADIRGQIEQLRAILDELEKTTGEIETGP